MNVLLLTWDYPPAKGGIQVWMFELARRLPDAEIEVFAPAARGGPQFDASTHVRVRRLPGAGLGPTVWLVPLVLATLWRCLLRRPDVVVCGHVVTGIAGLIVRKILGIPYVVFAYAYEVRRRRQRRLIQTVLKGGARVIAISRFTTESLRRLDVPADRIATLYPGVDINRFAPSHFDRPAARPLTLLTVSRLNDLYKGVDTMIRAMPVIRAKCPAVRYVIAGDGRHRTYLERLASSVGVGDDVVFLGEVSDDDLPDLYRSADVVVQLSREEVSGGGAEGFGIVCLEAGASGKPVVAGRAGGLVDAVEHEKTGLLVDPSELGPIAEVVISLLADREKADRMGRQGRARTAGEFTWDEMARKARELFAEAVRDVNRPETCASSV